MRNRHRISRRTFAKTATLGMLGVRGLHAFAAESRKPDYLGASCQTYIFNVVLGRKGEDPANHLDDVLGQIHAAGYGGVETMANYIDSKAKSDRFAELLEKHDLNLTGIYAGAALHEREAGQRAVESIAGLGPHLRKLGCAVLVTNPNPIGREKTDQELAIQADMLDRLGAALKENDVALNVHCHAPEMRSNAREFRSNLDQTDPDLVFLNADVHWIYRGGSDPYALLKKYVQRIGSNHLRNSTDGVWSQTLGPGEIDYERIAEIFARVPRPMWLTVELAYEGKTEETRPLRTNLAISREYVREVFGV